VEEGLIDEVILQLMSGKEASVYVVHSEGEVRCAKVYKDINNRNFKHNSQYTEGRKTRNSRQSRAMGKGSRFGRKEQEDAWQNAEVTALCSLAAQGVRVPKVYGFFDGVLIMELVVDEDGSPAPRLHDVEFSPELAVHYHMEMIREIVRMLCAGTIHGDLSEYNVLFGTNGPVIIDLPQAVNAAANNNAAKILDRDVQNMAAYFGQYAPELLKTNYSKEIWDLYKKGALTPETKLTGHPRIVHKHVDVKSVMQAIDDARDEEFDKKK
jgi:RIO kinase 1